MGSIPACTGEPARPSLGVMRIGVYPRVYGEPGIASTSLQGTGVYPRVYGGTIISLANCSM